VTGLISITPPLGWLIAAGELALARSVERTAPGQSPGSGLQLAIAAGMGFRHLADFLSLRLQGRHVTRDPSRRSPG
jgi:hypothetical protein